MAIRTVRPPSKESVREWLIGRYLNRTPLPDPLEIREQLGWDGRAVPDPSRRCADCRNCSLYQQAFPSSLCTSSSSS